jgi:type I restriction enzyme, S subunit
MSKPSYETYRDSEIQWLEYIPEHWKVQRIKEVGNIQYGLSQPPQYLEEGLPLIRATNIERGKLVEKGLVFISPDDVPWERNPALKENDILVVRSGAYTADSAIIPRKYHGSIAGFDMVLRPIKINPKYLSYTLLSNYLFKDQLILSSFRAAQPHLNKEELGTALIALPSPKEQEAIATYLDTKTAQIDRKIDLLTQKAQRYEELKRSLINETVMGRRRIDNGELIIDNEGGDNCQLSTVNYPLYKDQGKRKKKGFVIC